MSREREKPDYKSPVAFLFLQKVGPVSDGRPHLVWPVNANRPDNPIPTFRRVSACSQIWHRPPWENDKDQDGAGRPSRNRRSKGLQKRRMIAAARHDVVLATGTQRDVQILDCQRRNHAPLRADQ